MDTTRRVDTLFLNMVLQVVDLMSASDIVSLMAVVSVSVVIRRLHTFSKSMSHQSISPFSLGLIVREMKSIRINSFEVGSTRRYSRGIIVLCVEGDYRQSKN